MSRSCSRRQNGKSFPILSLAHVDEQNILSNLISIYCDALYCFLSASDLRECNLC